MSLIAAPILMDNKIPTKGNHITYSCPSPPSLMLMNGSKTQSKVLASLDSSTEAPGTVSHVGMSMIQGQFSNSARTSPVKRSDTDANNSLPTEMSPTSEHSLTRIDEGSKHEDIKHATTNSEQSLTEPMPDFMLSPNKRPRMDGSESASTPVTAGFPCPCGKQFSDSVIFIEHARQCEEFALTANSFAEAAAAVASAANGPKSMSTHSSESSPRLSKSATPTNSRLDKADINSPGNSSNSTEFSDPGGKNFMNIGGSTTGHRALDLSVRSQELQASNLSPDVLVRYCPECKYKHSNLVHLHHHFETVHNSRGRYECACGENFAWLPTLLKHRLYCTQNPHHQPQHHRTISANMSPVVSSECNSIFSHPVRSPSYTRSSSDIYSRTDWPSGTHVLPATKTLQCTACGKTGFLSPSEVLNHFTICPVLLHRSRSPNLGPPVSSSPFPRHTSSGSSLFGQWSSSPSSSPSTVSPLNGPLTTTSSVSAVHSRSDRNYSPPGYPFGFVPPLGYSPYSKQYSPRSSTTSFANKPVQKCPPKSNEMRPVSVGIKDAPNNLHQQPHHHHHHHNHVVNHGAASSSASTNHMDPQTNPDLTRPFKCCHCIKAFKSKALLDQHMHIHYPPKYTCRYCAKKYRWPPVFYHHQRTCKKRPPSTSASTTVGNSTSSVNTGASTTTTATHAFHTRPTDSNGTGTAESSIFPLPPGYFFSSPLDHHSCSSQNHSQNVPSQHSNSSRLSHPFMFPAPTHPSLHGHSFGSDLFGASLAAFYDPLSIGSNANCSGMFGNMGSSTGGIGPLPNPGAMLAAAAACAAMGIRVPFGHSLPPPPLGFTSSYNAGSASGSTLPFGQTTDPTAIFSSLVQPPLSAAAAPPPAVPLPPLTPLTMSSTNGTASLANPIPISSTPSTSSGKETNSSAAVTTAENILSPIHSFSNPALLFPSNGTATTSSDSIISNKTKTTTDGFPLPSPHGLLCVCGQQFGPLPTYLNHLANCATLQRLVQQSDKTDDVNSTTMTNKTSTKTTMSSPFLTSKDSASTDPNDSSRTSSKHTVNDSEALLFSSAAMAAMNAIMSRAKSSSDSRMKEDHCGGEMTASTSESDRTGLLESGWSGDHRQHHLAEPDLVPLKPVKKESTSDQEDFPSSQSPFHTNPTGKILKLPMTGHWRMDAKPDVTSTKASMKSTERNFGDTNQPDNTNVAVTSGAERTNIPSPTLRSSTVATDSTNLMAAMASVLANATAAAGFPILPDELSMCMSDISDAHLQGNESETTNSSGIDPAMVTFLMNSSVHAKLCIQCGKEFSSRLSLKQHVEGKHSVEGKYQCPGCAKRYRWGASYYYHKKSCPAIREPSPLSTDLCPETYDERDVNEPASPTPPRPALPLTPSQVPSQRQSAIHSPQDEMETENVSDTSRSRSDHSPSPRTERVREGTNKYVFHVEQDIMSDQVGHFRPLSFPLDMRRGRIVKTEDQYNYSPTNETSN
ncbi:Zinc finger protein [Fasciola gigantica]|uniref:Zinc finger protein n=1 Tax=Fasciola gigantica TaxID=46835 RepID=A0A504YPF1_FASGI|nr:Zinc finger protein [Fasciola gigantica]